MKSGCAALVAAARFGPPEARFLTIQRTVIANLIHIAGGNKHGGAGLHCQARMRGIEQVWPISKAHRKEVVERLGRSASGMITRSSLPYPARISASRLAPRPIIMAT